MKKIIWALSIPLMLLTMTGCANSSKSLPKDGIAGIRANVKKAEDEDGIGDYKLTVKGQDDIKPYTANITLNKADGYQYDTAALNALTAVKGIKKMHYKKFKNISITFTTTMLTVSGNERKNIPVLKYSLSPKTISAINPENLTDLKYVANYYWRRPLESD